MAGLSFAPLPVISCVAFCNESKVVFNWSNFVTNCFNLHYSILSSNCGNCPTTSDTNMITCTDVPMNGSVCRLHVQALFCERVNVSTTEPMPWQLIRNLAESCPSEVFRPTQCHVNSFVPLSLIVDPSTDTAVPVLAISLPLVVVMLLLLATVALICIKKKRCFSSNSQ